MSGILGKVQECNLFFYYYKILPFSGLLSRVMRIPAFCICKNKGKDQLRVDQRLCFHYVDTS